MSLTSAKTSVNYAKGGSSYLGGLTKKKLTKNTSKSNKNESSLQVSAEKGGNTLRAQAPLCTSIDNFYLTDFICENSAIMAKVSKTSRANKKLKRTSIYN